MVEYVNQKYRTESKPFKDCGSIEYDNSVNNFTDSAVKAEYLKSIFIPAIVYWQWNKTIKCELSSIQSFSSFNRYLHFYADSLRLGEKLNGQKLTITIESIPQTFVYTKKGFLIFLLLGYSTREIETITPENEKLLLSYNIVNGDISTKSGRIEFDVNNKIIKNTFSSTKNFTWQYLYNYEKNIRLLARNTIEKLLIE